jgi:hypothetical protein
MTDAAPTRTLLAGDPAKAAHLYREVIADRDDVIVTGFVAWGPGAKADLPAGIAWFDDSELEAQIAAQATRDVILCTHGATLPAIRGFAQRVESVNNAQARWVLPGMRQLMRRIETPVVAVSGVTSDATSAIVAAVARALAATGGVPSLLGQPGSLQPVAGATMVVLDAGDDTPWLEPDLWLFAGDATTRPERFPAKDAHECADLIVSAALDGDALVAKLRANARARGKRLG